MRRKKRQLVQDAVILAVSILFAIFITKTGLVHQFVASLDGFQYLGVFMAGIFFTSIFTTAPSIVILGEFAQMLPVWLVAILGGFGAMIGDYIIFRFVKDRVSDDIAYLLSSPQAKRFTAIFHTKLFHYFAPSLGALIIASPLPDELGIALLGLSKVDDKIFLPMSFILNSAGIFVIALFAERIVG